MRFQCWKDDTPSPRCFAARARHQCVRRRWTFNWVSHHYSISWGTLKTTRYLLRGVYELSPAPWRNENFLPEPTGGTASVASPRPTQPIISHSSLAVSDSGVVAPSLSHSQTSSHLLQTKRSQIEISSPRGISGNNCTSLEKKKQQTLWQSLILALTVILTDDSTARYGDAVMK